MACCRVQCLACRPVSTTSRRARNNSADSYQSFYLGSPSYQPDSAARCSAYSAQPSVQADSRPNTRLRRNCGRSDQHGDNGTTAECQLELHSLSTRCMVEPAAGRPALTLQDH